MSNNQNNQNIDIEEKRRFILQELNKLNIKQLQNFENFTGPGLKRKILRLIFSFQIDLPYLLLKLGFNNNNKLSKRGFFTGYLRYLTYFNDLKLSKFFIKNLKEDDVFYDIGANYGFYSYLALEFCKEVHLFEPQPDLFKNLSENLREESDIFLNNVALSNKSGIESLLIAGGESSIVPEIKMELSKEFKKEIEVQTITLDDYIKVHNKPSVLKIDVEGAEDLVLEGGKEFFKNNSPIIAMEVWSNNKSNKNHKKAVNFLRDLGYSCYYINNEGEISFISGLDYEIIKGIDNFIFKK